MDDAINLLETKYSKKTIYIKYVLSDLDNTLVGFDVAEPTEKVHDFIKQLKDNDLELIVVSNNNSKRLNKFCNPCSLKFLSFCF